jgi:hypothetical protein
MAPLGVGWQFTEFCTDTMLFGTHNLLFFIATTALHAPPTTPQCGNPHAGPVLGGVDFVAAFSAAGSNVSIPLGSPTHTVMLGNYTFWFQSNENAGSFMLNATKCVGQLLQCFPCL